MLLHRYSVLSVQGDYPWCMNYFKKFSELTNAFVAVEICTRADEPQKHDGDEKFTKNKFPRHVEDSTRKCN
jgi:hypothetical protein